MNWHDRRVNSTRGAGFADPDEPIPAAIRRLSAGAPVTPVWANELGGVAFRIETVPARFAKWAPAGSDLDLAAEEDRLRWAHRYATVPRVLDSGADASGSWMITAAVAGENAISDRWKADPERAVRVVGAALRRLHDSLPVAECPFDWSIQTRLERARRVGARAEKMVANAPPIDQLVVCHGDPCMPNTLIDTDGNFAGHVDLGELGVADRWADLAVGRQNTVGNYGPGFEDAYLEAYGVEPDHERLRFYQALWDFT